MPARPVDDESPDDEIAHDESVNDDDTEELSLEEQRALLEELWKQYRRRVYGLLRHLMGPDPERDDLVQEVFLRLARAMRTLKDPSRLEAFVVTVTSRTAYRAIRRRKVRRIMHYLPPESLPEPVLSSRNLPARAALDRVRDLLDALPPEERSLLWRRDVEDVGSSVLAREAGVSVTTIKRRLVKIRARLQSMAECDPALRAYMMELRQRREPRLGAKPRNDEG